MYVISHRPQCYKGVTNMIIQMETFFVRVHTKQFSVTPAGSPTHSLSSYTTWRWRQNHRKHLVPLDCPLPTHHQTQFTNQWQASAELLTYSAYIRGFNKPSVVRVTGKEAHGTQKETSTYKLEKDVMKDTEEPPGGTRENIQV